jgi:hypothetical protein
MWRPLLSRAPQRQLFQSSARLCAPWGRSLKALGVLLTAVSGGALAACSATDLELVERVPSAANNASEDSPAMDSTPVDSATEDAPTDSANAAVPPPVCGSGIIPLNRYRFRSLADSRCLSAGAATTVGGLAAYEVTTESDCMAAAATWQVLESTSGSFELRNVLVDFNLDVEYAEIEVGTPMVLFSPHGLENQKFRLTPVSDGTMTIAPRVAFDLCVQGDESGVFLNSCVPGGATQKWLVETENCPLADPATE